MVLPGPVLFPNTILPLRIFEPRYRAMLEWALEHDRMFCVALMKPGVTEAETVGQFFHTAGIGLISASVTQTDGTSNLMLQGLARVRFTGFSQLAPFYIAKIDPLASVTSDPAEAVSLAEELRRQCASVRVDGAALPESFDEVLARIADPDFVADTVAHSLVRDPVQRQRLLEEQNTETRLQEIARIIRDDFAPG